MMSVIRRRDPLKAATGSSSGAIAGAAMARIKEDGFAEIMAIGGGAINQATKAVIHARGMAIQSGINLVCIPSFENIEVDDFHSETGRSTRTSIVLLIEPR